MLSLSPALEAMLGSGVTTLCACWRVERRDGGVFGFAGHDRDLVFDGLVYQAGSGFAASAFEREGGLEADLGQVLGALDSAVLTEADLEAGLWSGARVESWLVDWTSAGAGAGPGYGQEIAPERRVRTGVYWLGEIRRVDGRFEADLLGREAVLERVTGRVFARRCDAELGDARCGVEAGHAAFGAGCDKAFATCRDRFANTLNFRGFPYMIGNDVLQAGPAGETRRDGGSRGLGG